MSVHLDNLDTIDQHPFTRALISVYDKTGLIPLARALEHSGVEIVSTGSTAACIQGAGIRVTPVEEVTGFPECLEGRVKTLHPHIHAGILADQRKSTHRSQLAAGGIKAFDLVICNLYPFAQAVESGASFDECIEQIDIGGPSMIRAAAKNHASVTVVVSPESYEKVSDAAKSRTGFTLEQRRALAAKAFAHTARYDCAISQWFAKQLDSTESDTELFPPALTQSFERVHTLRYGENPHQRAAVYRLVDEAAPPRETGETDESTKLAPGIANARQLHGKAMSYNNYMDADAALRAAYDHDSPCVAIVKHANPCGIALGVDIAHAHRKAHACDPVSAFGGVIAANRPVSVELAKQIVPIFTEVVLAPGYEDGAYEILAAKKNLRVLQVCPPTGQNAEFKQISGGLLLQERDEIDARGDDLANWTLVAGQPADARTLADLEFAWRTVRAVRSNAILLVKDEASVGVGMGQVNRVDSCTLAVQRANTLGGRSTGDASKDAGAQTQSADGARMEEHVTHLPKERSRGAVAASDAFFPFADGLEILISAGVKAVVQPGGSIRDEESIAAAKAAGLTMYLTGTRHFAH